MKEIPLRLLPPLLSSVALFIFILQGACGNPPASPSAPGSPSPSPSATVMTSAGVTEYPVQVTGSAPYADSIHCIALGADGNLWFTEPQGNKVARISPSGGITEYSLPTVNAGPNNIAAGPDGNLWFTESTANKVGKVSTASGEIVDFAIPTAGGVPYGIVAGPDGNLWFTEFQGNKVGKLAR